MQADLAMSGELVLQWHSNIFLAEQNRLEQCDVGTASFWQAAVGNGMNSNESTFKGFQRQQTLPN